MSKQLEALVIKWAEDRDIFAKATRESQFEKTLEEVRELQEAIEADNLVEAEDAIGDIIVTLIIQAEMWGLSATDCLSTAYGVISTRSGRMIDGQFVKDEERPHD